MRRWLQLRSCFAAQIEEESGTCRITHRESHVDDDTCALTRMYVHVCTSDTCVVTVYTVYTWAVPRGDIDVERDE